MKLKRSILSWEEPFWSHKSNFTFNFPSCKIASNYIFGFPISNDSFQLRIDISNLRPPNYTDAVKMPTIFCWLNYCWHNPEKHLLTTVLTFGTCVEFVVTNLIENVRFWGNGSEYDELLKSMCPRHLFDEHFQSFPL